MRREKASLSWYCQVVYFKTQEKNYVEHDLLVRV